MFKCIHCDYESKRKYNLQGHIKRIHKIDIKCNEITNSNINFINNNLNFNNSNINVSNNNINANKKKFKCEKCNKILKTKQGLKIHLELCKGVLNILECPYCHKILASYQSKYNHLKICKKKEDSLIKLKEEDNKEKTIINNGIINNGVINNNTIIINFDPYSSNKTEYNINDIELYKILKNEVSRENNKCRNLLLKCMEEIMNKDENKCIRKNNKNSTYSEYHKGDKEWKTCTDEIIYPVAVSDIANTIDTYIEYEKDRKLKKRRMILIDEFQKYLTYIIDKGEHENKNKMIEMKREFKNICKMMKMIIYNITKK
jgi:hypothetical protein